MKKKNVIVLIGAPGSGKGTLSNLFPKKITDYFSVGDLYRDEITNKTNFGRLISKYLSAGKLVPDEITNEFVTKKLTSSNKTLVILDGYPRSIGQYNHFQKYLSTTNHLNLMFVVYIQVSKEVLISRILHRRVCNNCGKIFSTLHDKIANNSCPSCHSMIIVRKDDNIDKFNIRYQVYLNETFPILPKYKQIKCYREFNGEKVNASAIYNHLWNDGLKKLLVNN